MFEREPARLRLRRIAPAIVAAVSLLATLTVTGYSYQLSRERDDAEFERHVNSATEAVARRLAAYVAILRAGAGLFSASEQVTMREFQAFVARLELATLYPGTMGVGYARRVLPQEREAFEQEMASELGTFRVWPRVEGEAFPIVFLEPQVWRNDRAVGYDMFSEPARRAAMERARDSGQAEATIRVKLVQETRVDVQSGFLIYVPVYEGGGAIPETPEARRQSILGFVYAPLRIRDMFRGIFEDEELPLHLALYDGASPAPDALMFDSALLAEQDGAARDSRSKSRRLEVAGVTWTLVYTPRPGALVSEARWTPLVTAGGLVLTAFLVSVTGMMAAAWRRADAANKELVSSRDELRGLTERFRVALKNAPITVYNTDPDLRYTWVANAPAGFTPESIIGRRDDEIAPGEDAEALMELKRKVLRSGVGLRQVIPFTMRGDERYFDLTIEPLRDAAENTIGLTVAAIDITEQKRAEVALAEHAHRLERSNRDLEDFAYIASHDLKEPLRGMANYAKFIEEDFGDRLPQEGLDRVRTIARLAQHMYGLLDSLLEYSRLGRTELAVMPVSIEEVVRDVLTGLQPRLEQENAEARMIHPMPTVRADRARIGQVFANLIANGLKYNTSERKRIEIGVRTDAPVPVFFVRDNGIGIDPKHQSRVFQMFKRLHARDQFGGGTGSGLTIAKKIVERHGGEIWLESQPGRGTTFYFTLQPTPGGRPRREEGAGGQDPRPEGTLGLRREHARTDH